MAETAASYKEKGDKIIEWAEKVRCPKEVQLSAHERITDTPIFLNTNVNTMKAYEPGNRIWVLAYMRIFQLKEVLIRNKKAKTK